MHDPRHENLRILAALAILITLGLFLAGCSKGSASNIVNAPTTTIPATITDAPADPVLGVKLTVESIVLTDTTGKTASILKNPAPLEAVHLDAVQEPFFTPAIPQDTYTSIAITVANPVVAFIDPTTGKVDVTGQNSIPAAVLSSATYTQTFSTPITISTAHDSMIFDFLVADSVSISGTTVTVTPTFHVAKVSIPATPTNGLNGKLVGYKGTITALDATNNDLTITDGNGNSQTIYVSGSTVYQNGLSGFSSLAVGALVEVDTVTQSNGTLLAVRIESIDTGATAKALLVGPVTAVTGSPATSFTIFTREALGKGVTSSTAGVTDTITVDGSTIFQFPQRYTTLAVAPPFVPKFDASSIFAGQHVAIVTTAAGVSSNTATAAVVRLEPQTVEGTVTATGTSGAWTSYTLSLSSTSWLAKLTGQTTLLVYTNSSCVLLAGAANVVSSSVRFNGFLFNDSGTLKMIATIQANAAVPLI